MSDILSALIQQIGGNNTVSNISNRLGAQDQNQVQSAMNSALPILLNALSRNSSNQNGASALTNALDRDHDGSILDDLAGFVTNHQDGQGSGLGILKHVLGDRQSNVFNAISQSSGLNQNASSSLLQMLAPMVLGYLGKQKRQQNMDQNGIAGFLNQFQQQTQQRNPQNQNILSRLLDKDGDGKIDADVSSIGLNLLGNLFK